MTSKKNPTLVNKSGKIAMKKNITIKSNINKTVKIQHLHQNPNLIEKLFKNIFITKNPLCEEWENCYEKEKVTELKIQQNKYNEIFLKKIQY